MEIILAVVVVGVLVPVGLWLGDEANGRGGWRQVLNVRERFNLGAGAFREARVELTRTEVLRERAPWWLRLLAFTCYLPLSAAIVCALPWLLGVLFLFERSAHHHGFDTYANALLVCAFPAGAWAALRMAGLGRALLSGDQGRFRAALRGTAALQLTLNGLLCLGALALTARFGTRDAPLLLMAPCLTLLHLAVVALTGRSQLSHHADAAAAIEGPDAAIEPRA